ncbi:CobW-like GTP-binding protein [Aeoliella sp. ICT_H6.2]|uniref:CobW-like GTP-binding protein n=1 Tax=Aeoliella straminimaris TaxID=2954799 RepID=A0A9X2JJP5_9BACT|nr:CobW-like GTP-binding protein [Aeoliella straminimaris]MCO6045239.1 CobW-like GTP-binding protein [Aeoliella straminimaris]
MSSPIRFILLGGCSGAGKSTTIGRLARHYKSQGLRVAVITNHLAAATAEAPLFAGQGLAVDQVSGACFCSRFDDLTAAIGRLVEADRPDIILAEPLGSCFDLVATVIRPLERYYAEQFEVAPYGVLLKPSQVREILAGISGDEQSDDVECLLGKQLEEADYLVLNRVDELAPADVKQLAEWIEQFCPGRALVRLSAKTGTGFGELVSQIEREAPAARREAVVDFDVYPASEPELGWLNSRCRVKAERPIDVDNLLTALVGRLRSRLDQFKSETAQLKIIGFAEGRISVASLEDNRRPGERSKPANAAATDIELIVNARVAVAQELLEQEVRTAVGAVAEEFGGRAAFGETSSYHPGRPDSSQRLVEMG